MYKKLLLSMILTLGFTHAKADVARTVMLRHNGQSTFFKYDEVQQAVDAATEGDTIYLTEGNYQPFTVDKRIMLRGVGPTSIIEGNCEINIPGTAKIGMPVFDAVFVNGDIIVNSAYDQFTLRKCKMANIKFNGTNHFDVKLTQCWITDTLNLTNNIKEFNAFNSRIYTLYPHVYSAGPAMFEHCGFYSVCDTIYRAVFNSSYIYQTSRGSSHSKAFFKDCVINNCRYYNVDLINTRAINSERVGYSNESATAFYRESAISDLDGTYIGIYGGQLPYKLEPELPTVTQHRLSVDTSTKTMHVNLTITKP